MPFPTIKASRCNNKIPDENKRAKNTKAFNKAVIQRARDNGDLQSLASPVTGGGLTVARFPQLFLLAISEGQKQPED